MKMFENFIVKLLVHKQLPIRLYEKFQYFFS